MSSRPRPLLNSPPSRSKSSFGSGGLEFTPLLRSTKKTQPMKSKTMPRSQLGKTVTNRTSSPSFNLSTITSFDKTDSMSLENMTTFNNTFTNPNRSRNSPTLNRGQQGKDILADGSNPLREQQIVSFPITTFSI